MIQPYLIAHKVRGEPAFDIAIKMDVETDDEPWWIIPTSGHRAYPYRHWSLDDLYDGSDMDMPQPMRVLEDVELPSDLRDHYEAEAAPRGQGSGTKGRDLLEKLGLVKILEPLTRRGW